jgi:hypothetical protein
MTRQTPSTDTPSAMAARIAGLGSWSWPDLTKEWRRLYGTNPLVINRRFVEKRIAYRWQEIEFEKTDPGLLARNKRRIDELIATGQLKRQPVGGVPVPGTVLIRVYDGVEHRVLVLATGEFEYAGKRYPSLSMVARIITGTRWSGPAFFGLRKAGGR